MQDIWHDIEQATDAYQKTAGKALNANQFSLYSITHHSTKIEGSTLTAEETNVLLEKGLSIGGKPIEHQNMVLDHDEALTFVLKQAAAKRALSIAFLQEIAAALMRRTGKVVNSVLGTTDEKKGEFRKVPVTAGGHYFVDAQKIPSLTASLVEKVQHELLAVRTMKEILTLSFTAHFDLVSIHPFTDGNGRTSRLLMNYIQAYHELPLTLVDANDRAAYIDALNRSRTLASKEPIVQFLAAQHLNMLTRQLAAFQASKDISAKGYSLIF